ncbi:hypothetical protein K2X96_03685 [Patescibacteria group bacterium]|nr:hypothetical protein [Patescibacteria group bacterium]
MKAILRALYSEIRGLHQSAYILAFFSVASQLLALVRDRLFAEQFGAGTDLDLYYAAFKVPDLLFVLFASVLSVYVLIPFVVERIEADKKEAAQKLLSSVLTVFVGVYVLVASVVAIWAHPIVSFVFPGFSSEDKEVLVLLMRVLLVQPFLLGISGMFSVVTQMGQRFVLYAISPLLYNGGIIFGVLALYPTYGLLGIVYGVIIGAVLHLLIQAPLLWMSPITPRLTLDIDVRALGAILKTSTPRALTLSLNQLVLLGFVGLASGMVAGSVSVFQFAFNLQSVALTIVGVSYSVAAFPVLVTLFSKGEYKEFVLRVETTLRHLVFWIVPIIALLVVLRAQFVRVVLGSGQFDWDDTRLTAAALALFSFSLLAQAVNLLIVRAFYAGGNTRTPFVVTFVSVCATFSVAALLSVLFVAWPPFAQLIESLLRVEGIPGTSILMLPLAYSLVHCVHAGYLLYVFMRTYEMPWRVLAMTFGRALVAGVGGGCVAYIILNMLVPGVQADTFIGVFLQGGLAGIGGFTAVVGLLYLMRSPELKELWCTFRKWPLVTRILGPDSIDTLAL